MYNILHEWDLKLGIYFFIFDWVVVLVCTCTPCKEDNCQRYRVTYIWCIWKEEYKFRKRKIILLLTGQWLKNSYLCNVDFLCGLGIAKSFNFLCSLSICVKEKGEKVANKTNSHQVEQQLKNWPHNYREAQHLSSASGQGCHANNTNERYSGMGWLCLLSGASKREKCMPTNCSPGEPRAFRIKAVKKAV